MQLSNCCMVKENIEIENNLPHCAAPNRRKSFASWDPHHPTQPECVTFYSKRVTDFCVKCESYKINSKPKLYNGDKGFRFCVFLTHAAVPFLLPVGHSWFVVVQTEELTQKLSFFWRCPQLECVQHAKATWRHVLVAYLCPMARFCTNTHTFYEWVTDPRTSTRADDLATRFHYWTSEHL